MSENEAPEVTFVGGRAVEQHEALDSNMPTDEREAAKAAVRKAIDEAGKTAASQAKEAKAKDPFRPPGAKSDDSETPERGPNGQFLPREGGKEGSSNPDGARSTEVPENESEGALDLEKASVKQLLRQREKVAAMKRDAKDETSKERQELAKQRFEMQQFWQEMQQQKAQLARERQSMQSLRTDPARAIREIGYDPEKFIMDLATEGTPEGQMRRKQQEVDSQLAEIRQWREQQAQQQAQYQKQAQYHQVVQAREQAVRDFTTLGLNEEKYPHVSSFYTGNERALVAFGDLAAEEYRNLSGGKEGSYADILDYIEDQLAERANAWYQKRSGQQAKPAEKPKSKGKTLNPNGSGERRAFEAKDLRDLDGDDRLEAAKQAVRVAMANS
jgi:hypothetical protein